MGSSHRLVCGGGEKMPQVRQKWRVGWRRASVNDGVSRWTTCNEMGAEAVTWPCPALPRTVQRGGWDPEPGVGVGVGGRGLLRVQQSPDSQPRNANPQKDLVTPLPVQDPREHPPLMSFSLSRSSTGTRPIHLW